MNAPLTPPECDLRGMPFMPVDLVRLFDSDLYALSTGDEFKAAFTLFGKAFLQVPAGSLPSDDRILAHLSGAGARWARVRDMALRGWIKCDDGRFYHPVVADKALEAWKARIAQRARTEAARQAKAAQRQDGNNVSGNGACQPVTASVTASVTDNVTASKGQGQGQGQLSKKESTPSLRSVVPTQAVNPKGCRLPEDWSPGPEDRAFAQTLSLDAGRVAEGFRDYWHAKPGREAVKLDWPATWRGWCRREAERLPQARQAQRQPANTGLRAAALANFQTIRPVFDLESFAEELPQ